MTARTYVGNHKQWDHTGSILPEPEWSESQWPHSELKAAPYLPVVRYDKKMEDWIVIMPGKVVAVDRDGRLVPAGLKMAFEVASGTTAITYTSNDYDSGTVDITTGAAYATDGTTTYTQNQVTVALRALGKIRATEVASEFISAPIGYAPYAQLQWCGGDGWNPTEFKFHNYNRQHQSAVGCDYMLQLPLVPDSEATETMGDGSIQSTALTFGTTQWVDSTALSLTSRFASDVSAGDNVVGYVFGKYPVAKITDNTPITDSASNLASMTEVASIDAVKVGGSSVFYIDYDAGVMFLYEEGGDAVPSGWVDGTTTITYYEYEDTASGAANVASVLGDVKPGDFLTFDANSNFVPVSVDIGTAPSTQAVYSADPDYSAASDAAISAQIEAAISEACFRTVAQVMSIETHPQSALDMVRTQYSGLQTEDKMPGSATGGMPTAVNISSASNKMVIVNFLAR